MLLTLIKIKLAYFFSKMTNGKKNNKLVKTSFTFLFIILYLFLGFIFYEMFNLLIPLTKTSGNWLYFGIMLVMMFVMAILGTIFLTYQEIYESKDNDLLLSLPIPSNYIVLSRMISLIILAYGYSLIVAIPALLCYMINVTFSFTWLIFTLIVIILSPIFSISVTCLLAYVLALIIPRLGKFKNIIYILTFILGFCLYLFLVFQFQNYLNEALLLGLDYAKNYLKYILPLYAGAMAISDLDIVNLLIYIACVIIPFVIVMYLLSLNFIKMATHKVKINRTKVKMGVQKANGITISLLKKELAHFFSSPFVILNASMGSIFSIIALGALVFNLNSINQVLNLIPSEYLKYLMPICAVIILSLTGFNIISSSLISLEGKNLWIIKSLPVDYSKVLNAKVYTNMLTILPFILVLIIGGGVILKLSFVDIILLIIIAILYSYFTGAFGLLTNLALPRFDWVSEVYCVKQSMSVLITMLICAFVPFGLVFIYFLLDFIDITIFVYLVALLILLLDFVLYYLIKIYGNKRFNSL